VRDPLGVRPLVIGKLEDAYVLASETCALDIIGAEYMRDVKPGEVVVISDEGTKLETYQPFPPQRQRFCIFEHIYFARPDSIIDGLGVYDVRKSIGAELAREAPVEADMVVPVPDSGVPGAIGYAEASKIPFELGIIRNHYVGRTFIEPTDHIRNLGVRLKHNANRARLKGKRVVLVDDSIVRGTTSKKIIKMVRDAGAAEVHFRIASPPMTDPCFYGVDTPEKKNLLAANYTVAEMCRFIEADSLHFISINGLPRYATPAATPRARATATRSPATTQRPSRTATAKPTAANSPFSPYDQASRQSRGAGHRRLARHRPCGRARTRPRRRTCHRHRAHDRRTRRTRQPNRQAGGRQRACAWISKTASLPRLHASQTLENSTSINAGFGRLPRGRNINLKNWIEAVDINVNANLRLIQFLDPLLKASDAGRAIFVTSGAATNIRAYWSVYSATKAALDVLIKTYAAECATTKVRANLFSPGPVRTGMRAKAFPGEDPMTLPTPEDVAPQIVALGLPTETRNGEIIAFKR
jgi:hypothetical protein